MSLAYNVYKNVPMITDPEMIIRTLRDNHVLPDSVLSIVKYSFDQPTKLLDWINPNKINWSYLSSNPDAIHLLEKNPDKINWNQLSANPAAIHLLEKNLDKIDWDELSRNISIFGQINLSTTVISAYYRTYTKDI